MSNTIKNNATSVNNAPHSVTEKGGSTSLKEEQKLTGRLEVRLPPDVELALLKLIANNTKTKSLVICRLIKRCRLFFHLTKEEIDVYMALKDCKDAFVKLKSVLNSFNEKERLKFFHNNPDYMENWIAVVDQCIEQWDRILQKLSE